MQLPRLISAIFLFLIFGDSKEDSVIHLSLPSGEDPNGTVRSQRDFVKQMMKFSWDSYKRYAWGWDELKANPNRESPNYYSGPRLGATIIGSLDTLLIMNMTEEFSDARDWVDKHFNLKKVDRDLSLFNTIMRTVGGLLSAFALTDDKMFLQKARQVMDLSMTAFNTKTGLQLIYNLF